VFATKQATTMKVQTVGQLAEGVTAKDLALITAIGTDGATGFVIEYAGEAVRGLSMEGRMTLCNRASKPRAQDDRTDETTFEYMCGRTFAPKVMRGMRGELLENTRSDNDAVFDHVIEIDASALEPFVTWGTNPAWSYRLRVMYLIQLMPKRPRIGRLPNAHSSTWP
jgi:3-isopropylmalate/(R)-2-methylmalate dehydratase large subunit